MALAFSHKPTDLQLRPLTSLIQLRSVTLLSLWPRSHCPAGAGKEISSSLFSLNQPAEVK